MSLISGLRGNDGKWTVNSSCANLPAALNDPAKGTVLDPPYYFMNSCREWGVKWRQFRKNVQARF
jgi:hypothetical protein